MSTPLIFLAVLSVLVLIHELGHFLTAKYFGIRVEEFALGLPFTRSLFSVKRGETTYSVYPLLFGGFVRMHGEESDVTESRGRSFWNRGKKQRMAVIVAGVVMNMVLALVAFVVLYSIIGVPTATQNKVTLVRIEEGSPAALGGLLENDRVVAVEGKPVATGEEFGNLMRSWGGLEVNLTVERGAGVPLFEGIAERGVTTVQVAVEPRAEPPEGQGPLGVGIADFPYLQTEACNPVQCVAGGVGQGVKTTGLWIGRVVDGLRSIGQSLSRGKAPEGVSGPIGIYQLTDVVSQGGFLPLLELTAILSVNLAVFNILPIPALDGGRAFFIWLEWVRRKRVSGQLEQKINSIGMAVLLTLIVLITLQDVLRLGLLNRLFGGE